MNASRFDMAQNRKEALRLSRCKPDAGSAAKWGALKASAREAMASCEPSAEEGRLDHGGLLLFLCAVEDLEKMDGANDVREKERLSLTAAKKFDSAIIQYDRT